jgi:purine-binding chemotaxis protein CheW
VKAEEQTKGFAMTDNRMGSSPEGSGLQLIAFNLEGQSYGHPVTAVDRALPMVSVSLLPQGPAIALGVINLHGQIHPVVDLWGRFCLFPREYGLAARLSVVRMSQRARALPCEKVLDQSALPGRPCAPLFGG